MNSDLYFDRKKYISAKKASTISGYTSDHIGLLCRQGKLTSQKVGKSLFVSEESFFAYVQKIPVNSERNKYLKNISQNVSTLDVVKYRAFSNNVKNKISRKVLHIKKIVSTCLTPLVGKVVKVVDTSGVKRVLNTVQVTVSHRTSPVKDVVSREDSHVFVRQHELIDVEQIFAGVRNRISGAYSFFKPQVVSIFEYIVNVIYALDERVYPYRLMCVSLISVARDHIQLSTSYSYGDMSKKVFAGVAVFVCAFSLVSAHNGIYALSQKALSQTISGADQVSLAFAADMSGLTTQYAFNAIDSSIITDTQPIVGISAILFKNVSDVSLSTKPLSVAYPHMYGWDSNLERDTTHLLFGLGGENVPQTIGVDTSVFTNTTVIQSNVSLGPDVSTFVDTLNYATVVPLNFFATTVPSQTYLALRDMNNLYGMQMVQSEISLGNTIFKTSTPVVYAGKKVATIASSLVSTIASTIGVAKTPSLAAVSTSGLGQNVLDQTGLAVYNLLNPLFSHGASNTGVTGHVDNQKNLTQGSIQTIVQQPATTTIASTQHSGSASASLGTTIIQNITRNQTIAQNIVGVSQTDLASALQKLNDAFNARLNTFSVAQSSGGGNITNVYQEIASSQKIDNLYNTAINNPTISGGTISNTSIINSPISATTLTGNTLNISSSSTFAGATFSGNVGIGTTTPTDAFDVIGNVNVSGTLTIGSLFTAGGQTIGGDFAVSGTTTVKNLLVTGSTTVQNLNFQTASGTTATSTNIFATNLVSIKNTFTNTTTTSLFSTTASSTNLFSTQSTFANATIGNLTVTGNTTYSGTGTTTFPGDILVPGLSAYKYLTTSFIQATSTTATNFFAGNVGIGTTSPVSIFSVVGNTYTSGNSTTTGRTYVGNDLQISRISTPAAGAIYFGNTYANALNFDGSNYMFTGSGALLTAGSQIIAQSNSNSWGIGAKYSAGSGAVYFGGTNSATPDAVFSNTAGTERARITDAGSLGIGTTTPYARLSVSGIGGAPSFVIGSSTGTQFIVDKNGNVGIGMVSPTNPFDLTSSMGNINGANVNVTGGGSVAMYGTASGAATIGIEGQVLNSSAVTQYGLYGTVNGGTSGATNSYGVYGTVGTGPAGTAYAGYFSNPSGLTTTNYGIYASATGGGTNNYAGYFSATGNANHNYGIIVAAGNVGIGTTSPNNNAFEVNGNSYISGTSFFGGAITGTSTINISGLATFINSSTTLASFSYASTTNLILNGSSFNNLLGSGLSNVGGALTVSSLPVSSISLTKGNFLVGNDAGIAQATSSIFVGSTGHVGIGTTAPNANLDIQSTVAFENIKSAVGNGAWLTVSNTNNSTYFGVENSGANNFSITGDLANATVIAASGANAVQFGTNSNARMTIDGNGNVGVGTTSPTQLLSVGSSGGNSAYFAGNVGIGTNSPNGALQVIGTTNITAGLASLSLSQAGGSLMQYNGDQVFLGNNSYITMNGTSNYIQSVNNNGVFSLSAVGTNAVLSLTSGTSGGYTSVTAGGAERLRVTSGGNVGIGSTTPFGKFAISANNGDTNSVLFNIASSTANATTSILTVLNNGNVGVGVNNPGYKLQVGGEVYSGIGGGFRVNSINGDDVYNAPWYGIGVNNASFSGSPANSVVQVAGYYGIMFKTSLGESAYTSAGNFGIGDTAPSARLSVVGNAVIGYASGQTGPANGLAVSGNVGIGSTSPGYGLSVAGSGYFDGGTVTAANIIATSSLTISGLTTLTTASTSLFSAATGFFNNIFATSTTQFSGFGATTSPYAQLSINSVAGSPSFVIGSSTATSFIVDKNGNVGVGTTNPKTKFEIDSNVSGDLLTLLNTVGGNGNTSGLLFARTSGDYFGRVAGVINPLGSRDLAFYTNTGAGSSLSEVVRITGAGSFGIGTTTPFGKFAISANNGDTNSVLFTIASSTASATTSILSVLNNGNVGVGTTTPQNALSVNGGIEVTNSVNNPTGYKGLYLGYNPGTNIASISSVLTGTSYQNLNIDAAKITLNGASGGNVIAVTSGANFGIGTTTPTNKLDVNGNVYFSGTSFHGGAIIGTSTLTISGLTTLTTASTSLFSAATGFFNNIFATSTTATSTFSGGFVAGNNAAFTVNQAATANSLYVAGNGNVGVGMTNPASALDVSGSINASGNITVTAGSGYLRFGSSGGRSAIFSSGDGLLELFNNAHTDFARLDFGGTTSAFPAIKSINTSTGTQNALQIIGADGVSNANLLISGNVGIGTTSPGSLLDVSSASAGARSIQISDASQSATSFDSLAWTSTAGALFDYAKLSASYGSSFNSPSFKISVADGTRTLQDRFVIDKNGNVGIGSTTPGYKLSVAGSGYFDGGTITAANIIATSSLTISGLTTLTTASTSLFSAATGFFNNIFATSTTATSTFSGGFVAGNNAAFTVNQAATANSLYVAGNGNVGIGTTSPGFSLDVAGASNTTARIWNQTGGNTIFDVKNGGSNVSSLTSPFQVQDSSGNTMASIDYRGYVYTSDLNANNDGFGLNQGTGLAFGNNLGFTWSSTSAWYGGNDLGLNRFAAGVMKVTNGSSGFGTLIAGTIGIGTTTPTANLLIQGTNGQTQNLLTIASSTGKALYSISNLGGFTDAGIIPSESGLGYANLRLGVGPQGDTGRIVMENNIGNVGEFDVRSNHFSFYGLGQTSEYFGIYTNGIQTSWSDASFVTHPYSFVSATSTTPSYISGNLGVGTTTPFGKFAISANNGDTNSVLFSISSSTASATTTLFSINNAGQLLATTSNTALTPAYSFQGFPTSGFYATSAGNLRIEINGSNQLLFNGGGTVTAAGGGFINSTNGTASGVSFGFNNDLTTGFFGITSGGFGYASSGVEKLRLDSTGNLGIGTTSPADKFSVNTGATGMGVYIAGYANGTGNLFTVSTSTLTSTTTAFVIDSNGKVGIGTSTPGYPLDVQSSISVAIGSYGFLNSAGSTGSGGGTTANMSINAAGRILAPEFDAVSDARLKNVNFSLSPDVALNALAQLKPVSFNWKNQPNGEPVLGFLAQDVETVIPNAVSQMATANFTDQRSLDYNQLTAVTIGAVQALNIDIQGLTASSTATSTPASQSFAAAFWINLFSRVGTWLADATNGIGDFFANAIHAKQEICVDDQCLNKDDVKALLLMAHQAAAASMAPGSGNGGGSTSATSTPAGDTTAPIVSVVGDNPATIHIGASYIDLGATVTDTDATGSTNNNLDITASVDGATSTPITDITIDTMTTGTHTVVYSATDQAGNIGTITRTVVVQ